jgi:alkanesulfonate monooxygenase SsuD/methylene tetrahydromethanopterin reductase-like flavin-dependent oxidoreductase (luciferase family)
MAFEGVGVFLPQLRMGRATIEERVLVAEEVGFHSVWLMDHMAPPAGPQHDSLEGWTLATWLAARTTTIRLGHLVLCAPFRHPALLAKMAATLDVLCDGRLELGLGWGSVPDELVRYGFGDNPAAHRAAHLEDTLEVLQRMFTGEPFSYEGNHLTLTDALGRPTPVQAKVPIHLGGAGKRLTLPLVARYADWWNCPTYALEQFDELRPLAGNARISVQRVVALAPSTAEREDVVATAERRFGGWGGVIAGTPDEVVTALQADRARGVELFVVQFADFGVPATLRLFADEVAPALAR